MENKTEFPVIFSDYQAIMGASRMITGSNWIDTLKGRTLYEERSLFTGARRLLMGKSLIVAGERPNFSFSQRAGK